MKRSIPGFPGLFLFLEKSYSIWLNTWKKVTKQAQKVRKKVTESIVYTWKNVTILYIRTWQQYKNLEKKRDYRQC